MRRAREAEGDQLEDKQPGEWGESESPITIDCDMPPVDATPTTSVPKRQRAVPLSANSLQRAHSTPASAVSTIDLREPSSSRAQSKSKQEAAADSIVPPWHAALAQGMHPAVKTSRSIFDQQQPATPTPTARIRSPMPSPTSYSMSESISSLDPRPRASLGAAKAAVAAAAGSSSSISFLSPTLKRSLSAASPVTGTPKSKVCKPDFGASPRSTPVGAGVASPSVTWHPTHPVLGRLKLYHDRVKWLEAITQLAYFRQHASQYAVVFQAVIRLEREKQANSSKNNSSSLIGEGTASRPIMLHEDEPGAYWQKNSGRGLEEYIAMLYRLQGWTRVQVKAGAKDGGIDVLASLTVARGGVEREATEDEEEQEQAAFQCKQFYPSGSNTDLTMETVGAFHSALTRLPFFNQQQRSRHGGATSAPAAEVDLLPEAHRIRHAYLVTTGTFSKQARQFVDAFHRRQRMEAQMRDDLKQIAPNVPSAAAWSAHWSKEFTGVIHLVDHQALEALVVQIETSGAGASADPSAPCASVVERAEVHHAIELVSSRPAKKRLFDHIHAVQPGEAPIKFTKDIREIWEREWPLQRLEKIVVER